MEAEQSGNGTEAPASPELPPDDSDLEAEEQVEAMLEDRLSEEDEDMLDDIGLDMNEIVAHMAQKTLQLETEKTKEGQS